MYLYIIIVPAIHSESEIQVFDDVGETKFTLIEHKKTYKSTWNTEKINRNEFDEVGKMNFSIENWLFQTHQVTNITAWLSRQDLPRPTQRQWFQASEIDSDNGNFSFKQTTRSFAKIRFGISIIVVKKKTENLEIMYTSSLLSFVPNVNQLTGREAIIEFCRLWNTGTDEIVEPKILKRCPCTLESARMDPNLNTDFTCSATEPNCHENVNAHRCYLIKVNNSM